jgi:hypothetical protein
MQLMNNLAPGLTAACWLLIAPVAYSQGPQDAVRQNTEKLKVTIAMDRTTYFSGEVAHATIEVTNPTGSAMVVLEPFRDDTGCVDLDAKVKDKYIPLDGADHCPPPIEEGLLPTTTFGPGERRQIVLKSYGGAFAGEFMLGGGVPDAPGTYQVTYGYGPAASVEFTVVLPRAEADVVARLQDIMLSERSDGKDPHPIPTYVHVLALRSGDETQICVAQKAVTNLERDPTKKTGEFDIIPASPFKRVASSFAPVARLAVTADAQENLTIEWTDSTGRTDRAFYQASYVLREEHARQRALMKKLIDQKQ